MYIRRHLEEVLDRAAAMFSAVIVTGAPQVGKTRLLEEHKKGLPYLSLDDPMQVSAAINEPGTFFKRNPPPVVVDEIQYAPNLFPYIKLIADQTRECGLFFLSGSQQFSLMKGVTESLAGRIGVLNLLGLSRREIAGSASSDSTSCGSASRVSPFTTPFLPTEAYFKSRTNTLTTSSYADVWNAMFRGSLPLAQYPQSDWQLLYSSYLKTYIERDVRQLMNVGNEMAFLKFMTAIAANSGRLLNLTSISNHIGMSLSTVERWLSILITSNLVYLLKPYHNNVLKGASKMPKLYVLDTGLICYLTRWLNPEVLEHGAAAGEIFETYVVGEIIKSYTNAGIEPPLYFYRDQEQNEIDLLIHENGVLYPLEIKKHANPRADDIKAFHVLDKIPGITRRSGGVICLYDRLVSLGEHDVVIPLDYI